MTALYYKDHRNRDLAYSVLAVAVGQRKSIVADQEGSLRLPKFFPLMIQDEAVEVTLKYVIAPSVMFVANTFLRSHPQ